MTYNPWLDAAERYPQIHIERWPIAPLHAALMPHEGVILIAARLTKTERRCALAHELAHLDAGDRATDLCWFAARQETVADKLAARRLVDIGDFIRARMWASDSRELASDLGVTTNVLRIRWHNLHPREIQAIKQSMIDQEAVA